MDRINIKRKQTEQKAWLRLSNILNVHAVQHTRIETNTQLGVPDIFLAFDHFSAWVELKCLPEKCVRVRTMQRHWLHRNAEAGACCLVINYDPNTDVWSIYFTPFDWEKMGEGGSDRIMSEPLFIGSHMKLLKEWGAVWNRVKSYHKANHDNH